MPLYQFYCKKCDSIFDDFGSIMKPPTRRKCPECKTYAKRWYAVETQVKVGNQTELKTLKRRATEGFNKEESVKFYKESIENSKERMKTGYQHYKNITLDIDKAHKLGMIKKASDERAQQKKEAYKQIANDVSKKGIKKSPHPQKVI